MTQAQARSAGPEPETSPETAPRGEALSQTVVETQSLLAQTGYIASIELATAIHLSSTLARPLFLEGEAGTGKTAIAQALAQAHALPLVRLQCDEGLEQAEGRMTGMAMVDPTQEGAGDRC